MRAKRRAEDGRVTPRYSRRRVIALLAVLLATGVGPGCVRERLRGSTLDQDGRVVSVELRRRVTGVGYTGVLFTPLDAEGAEIFGFTPSDYDIARMEAVLPQLLQAAGPRLFEEGLPELPRYRRQYSGYRNGERRIIQTNFLRGDLIAERSLDWKNRREAIRDAGPRAFQLWFDADSRQVIQLLPDS